MRGEEDWRCKAVEARPTIDHVRSVTGVQKLCKTPVRQVRHNRKSPKIEISPVFFNHHKSTASIASRGARKTQGEARGEGDPGR